VERFFLAGGLTMATIRDEVAKSAQKLDSVLIVYSAKVGLQLQGAMTDQVLILRSWPDESAAEYAFANKYLDFANHLIQSGTLSHQISL
jgi:hypothetical protein